MKTFPLSAALAALACASVALTLPAEAQKKAGPAGESPGPWIADGADLRSEVINTIHALGEQP